MDFMLEAQNLLLSYTITQQEILRFFLNSI